MTSKSHPVGTDEKARVAAFHQYRILENLSDEQFDDVARLVAYICQVPMAHVSFLDDQHQWFKSTVGFEAVKMPKNETFCQYTIMNTAPLEVNDTLETDLFRNDPNVQGGFKIRFYAGIPLTTPDGYNIGTICAIDQVPRELNEEQRNALSILAKHIMVQLELEVKIQQLDRQTKLARQAVLAKDTFLANMSHEIRTPLNAIIGFTDLLAQTSLTKKQSEFLDSVQMAGESLNAIVNDILDLSKIESGTLNIESLPFNIKQLVKSTFNLIRVRSKEAVELNLYMDPEIPDMLKGDKARLAQILINLLGNAIKFTDKGEISLSVKHVDEEKGIHTLRFCVKDSGIGIQADQLERIFARFTQAEDSTTRRFGGTGLGLNIVKQLVELQGGSIHVKSTFGKGSDFTVTLAYPEAMEVSSSDVQVATNNLGRLHILLCEDNELNQKLAVNVLQNFGFTVDVAVNGKEGIDMLMKGMYDMILMDLQMPVQDGYETSMQIRNEMKLDIPIIAMTAHSLVGEKQKCFESGMNGYVPKPFKQHELLSEMEQVMRGRHEAAVSGVIIDYSYLEQLSGHDHHFIKEMMRIFVQKVPSEMDALKNAVKESDYSTASSIAHNLRSSLSMFMLKDLEKDVSLIEKDAISRNFTETSVLAVDRLLCGIRNTVDALKGRI